MQNSSTSPTDEALQRLREAGMPPEKEDEVRKGIDRAVQCVTSPGFQKKAAAKQVRRQLAALANAADKLEKAFSQLGPEATGAICAALPRPQWSDYDPVYRSAEEAFRIEVLPWAEAASRAAEQERLPGYAGNQTRESWAFEFVFQLIAVFEWATGRAATQFYNDKLGRYDSAFRRFVDAAAALLPDTHRGRVTFTAIIDSAIEIRKRSPGN